MLLEIFDHIKIMKDDDQEEVDGPTDPILPESLTDFCASINNIDGRNSEASLRQQRAGFDMEGNTSG